MNEIITMFPIPQKMLKLGCPEDFEILLFFFLNDFSKLTPFFVVTRNLSRLSATLHQKGDLNKDREQIEKLAKLLSRYVTTIHRSDLDRQQLLDSNEGTQKWD